MKEPVNITRPTNKARAEAKKCPNGYVYVIYGEFGPNDAVPPEAVVGAWQVNSEGEIVGEFTPNPYYHSATEKQG